MNRLILAVILLTLLLTGIAWNQESPKRAATPNQPTETDIFEEHLATDGRSIWVTTVKGSDFVACKNMREYVPLNALKGSTDWTDKVNLEEDLNRCVLADHGDLVYVQPADRDGVLAVSFRGRADVHPSLAWFINCEALPRVADLVCSYAE